MATENYGRRMVIWSCENDEVTIRRGNGTYVYDKNEQIINSTVVLGEIKIPLVPFQD